MSIPVAYTPEMLAQYMHNVLGKTATALGWTALDSYEEAVTSATLAYGVTDLVEATDIPKLRAVARMEAWRAVMDQTAGYTDISMPDGVRIVRHQAHNQARAAFLSAKRDAMTFGIGHSVTTTPIASETPYTYQTIEERARS